MRRLGGVAKNLNLFYGPDSYASLGEVQRWAAVFERKYGSATRFVINADELDATSLEAVLRQRTQSLALFPEPQFIILKRLVGLSLTAATRAQVGRLLSYVAELPSDVSVAVWEERDLPDDHPLVLGWQQIGTLRRFIVPEHPKVTVSLTPEATAWLREQYRLLGELARPNGKSKTTAPDERSWWLHALLNGAVLRADGELIDLITLQAGVPNAALSVGAFAIVTAIEAGRFEQAHELAERLIGDSAYFGLYGALHWQFANRSRWGDRCQIALRLLAEAEIASKIGDLIQPWILHQLLERLERAYVGTYQPLFPPRTLWLAGLPT
jgi:hypothetical protein